MQSAMARIEAREKENEKSSDKFEWDIDRQSLKYRCQINNNGAKAVMQYSIGL